MPSTTRTLKLTAYGGFAFANGAVGILLIQEGTSQVGVSTVYMSNSSNGFFTTVMTILNPTPGQHTYKVVAQSSTGSATFLASADAPAFLLAELS